MLKVEMISSKVVLTYKRKRYRSGLERACGIDSPKSISESPSDNLSNVFQNHVESSKPSSSEIPEGDARDVPHGQGLCTACVKEQDSRETLQHSVTKSRRIKARRRINDCKLGPTTLHSLNMLQTTEPGEGNSKETGGSFETDASPENRSNYTQMSSCSHVNSVSSCSAVLPEGSSVFRSVYLDTQKKTSSACLEESIEQNYSFGCTSALFLKNSNSENIDSLEKNESDILPHNNPLKNKFSTSVITYHRKEKRKQSLNETEIQNKVIVKEEKHSWSSPASGVVDSYEDASKKCSAVSQSVALISLKEDPEAIHLSTERRDKKIRREEVTGSTSKTKIARFLEQNQYSRGFWRKKCQVSGLKSSASITNLKVINEDKHLELSDVGPSNAHESEVMLSDSVKEIMKPDVNEDKHPELPNGGVPNVQACETISSGGGKEMMKPDDFPVLESHSTAKNAAGVDISHKNPVVASAPEALLDRPTLTSPDHVTGVHGDEPTQKAKIRKSLETTDDALQEVLPSHCAFLSRKTFLYMEEDGNNYKDCGMSSTMYSAGIPFENPHKQRCTDDALNQLVKPPGGTACISFKGTAVTSQSGCGNNQYSQIISKSSLCQQFPGPSFQSSPVAATSSFSSSGVASFPSSTLDKRTSIQEMAFQSFLDKGTSLRHMQILDNIIARARIINGNQGYSVGNLKGCTRAWSEEELDFLWIGVRRYGRNNWHAVLRDPRLWFAEGRVAVDLAERWVLEQSKLVEGTQIQPTKLSNAPYGSADFNHVFLSGKGVAGSPFSSYPTEGLSSIGSQTLVDDTRLSLGDVYVQRELNTNRLTGNNELANSILERNPTQQLQKPSEGRRRHLYSNDKHAIYNREFPFHQPKPAGGSSVLDQYGSGVLFNHGKSKGTLEDSQTNGGGNLPHWLREVVNVPPQKLSEFVLPSHVSAVAESVSLHNNDTRQLLPPFSDHGAPLVPPVGPRQRLGMKRTYNKLIDGPKLSDIPASVVHSSNSFSKKTNASLFPTWSSSSLIPPSVNLITSQTKAKDLVIVESDASSEETISDHQSGRP